LTSLLRLHLSSGALSPRWVSTLLSWDSSAFRPCCRHTRWRSTPRDRDPLRPDAATRRISFRPRGFAPPRRLAPSRCRGLVASHCQPGVRRVSDPPRQTIETAWSMRAFPPAHHTPRRIPLISSRTASPQPLPSCRYAAPHHHDPGIALHPKVVSLDLRPTISAGAFLAGHRMAPSNQSLLNACSILASRGSAWDRGPTLP
jgi:hypothetical protein